MGKGKQNKKPYLITSYLLKKDCAYCEKKFYGEERKMTKLYELHLKLKHNTYLPYIRKNEVDNTDLKYMKNVKIKKNKL